MSKAASISALQGVASFRKRAKMPGFFEGEAIFPGRKTEHFHFTPLKRLEDTAWGDAPALSGGRVKTFLEKGKNWSAGLGAENVVVILNGRFSKTLSRLTPRFQEMFVCKSCTESAENPEGSPENFLERLNESMASELLSLKIPAGVDAGTLLLLFLNRGENVSVHPRLHIELGRNSRLSLRACSQGEGRYLFNPALEIVCAEAARLDYLHVQDDSRRAIVLAALDAEMRKNSRFSFFGLNKGGQLARMDICTRIGGRGSEARVNGLQFAGEGQFQDFTSVIEHQAESASSYQKVKSLVSAAGQGVFQGKIHIFPNARKSDGYQMNQALLLTENASFDARPELEIYADDVKCSHGATIGALDEEELFYLQARGLPAKEAEAILQQAFVAETLDLLTDARARDWLRGFLPFEPEAAQRRK